MHILEHLINPEIILEKTINILNPNGKVIICLPNISNWENRLEMFKGDFNYTDIGVMDKTHLRFFNYFTAIEFIQKAGFKVDRYSGLSWPIRFKLFKDVMFLSYINDYFNRFVHKITGPNFTDRITMFEISLKSKT
jgi:2-polyprenyl-3-methyl-5-hydroxy-6-metoxy-1,4-benzoquinol methylase